MQIINQGDLRIMGTVIDSHKTNVKMDDGNVYVRRVTKVLCPNGKYRYPVDYYDATPGAVKVSRKEHESLGIPVYEKLI